ncbi:hypothetical protein [Almyronema epifaneia]|uniref:Uncharacterized protein n=1 Tax=Almyronema epifaneia S1 TaxID=2991925 RepID=A0ABW6IL45_9CYAN
MDVYRCNIPLMGQPMLFGGIPLFFGGTEISFSLGKLMLTLQQLAAKLPAGSFTETADDVTVSLKAVTGDAAVQLDDTLVAESLSKILDAAAAAQTDYNAANPNSQISSYPEPSFGTPVSDGAGGYAATKIHSLTVSVPLNVGATVDAPL